MRVGYTGKSVNLNEREREYVEKKLQRLARHFSSAREATVSHSTTRNWHQVEAQLDLNGMLVRAEARSGDVTAAIDQVADKLEEQVRRLKGKLRNRKGKADAPTFASLMAELPEEDEPQEEEVLPTIARRKRFSVKAMTSEEAVLQMELLHHDFFAFLNAESGEPNILYRRKDGDFGLLELDG